MLAPIAARRLARAAAADPEFRERRRERLGRVPDAGGELWIHAASVGELAAAEPLVARLLETGNHRLLISTMTHTAASRARAVFGDESRVRHLFAPLDTRGCVRRWLDHTRPDRLVLVETEIWPVLLDECCRRGIPVAMVNARLSARSLRRYRRFPGLFRAALADVEPLLCQSEADRDRLATLVADPSRLRVTGNIKFDRPLAAESSPEVRAWAEAWSDRPCWVAGSTHPGEERIVAEAQRELLASHPDALAVVVPRHPDRAAEVLATLQRAGLDARPIGERSDRPGPDAVVVDRMGVLEALYGRVDALFVGGSLVAGIGGHNLIEAAASGRPVSTGPFVDNQRDAADLLADAGALARVDSATDLAATLAGWFDDPESATETGRRGRAAVEGARGALERTARTLGPWLEGDRRPDVRPGG